MPPLTVFKATTAGSLTASVAIQPVWKSTSVQNLASVNHSRARGQSAEDKNGLARGLRVKQPVRSFRLVEIEPMRHQSLERHFPVHNEARALRLPRDAERPRCVNGQLTTQQVLADVEGGCSAFADECDATPCASAPYGGHARVGHASAVHCCCRSLTIRLIVNGRDWIGLARVDDRLCPETLCQLEPFGRNVRGYNPGAHRTTEHRR